MGYVVGVDIGGTFTDCVALAPDGTLVQAKTLSTHGTDPGDGVVTGIALLAEALGLSLEDLLRRTDRVSHGTTIGTNLIVEHKGGPVGLITTIGHGDVMEIMRGNGRTAGLSPEQVFDVARTGKPAPLVPRPLVEEVQERIDASGAVIVRLDEPGVRAAVERLVARGVNAIAVSTLWSFVNPAHERRIGEIVREVAPELFVSLGHEVSPRLGEYERTVATVINSYIGPASTRYLERTRERLDAAGLAGSFLVMQANGGVIPVDEATRLPITTLDSGPAGGLAGTAAIASALGDSHVIATDMGGTSFDVGLVVEGTAVIAEDCVLNQYAFHQPHLDCRSIACGGGSIAHTDRLSGSMRVGPHSAGSVPGPAAYGRGGSRPTVTDADVVLGLLSPSAFLDGRMALDREAAVAAMTGLAQSLGVSVEEAAVGVLRVNNNAAANLIRRRTIEQGLDPRDFTLYAFGGAGPVHAFGFAEELGIANVVIPLGNGASTLSAFGIAASDMVRYFDRSLVLQLPAHPPAVAAILDELEVEARAALGDAGEVRIERFGLMRYAQQYLQSLPLPLPDPAATPDWNDAVKAAFCSEYARLYGEGALVALQTIEFFALRVRASVRLAADWRAGARGGPAPDSSAASRSRRVFWPSAMDWIDTTVWDGRFLPTGFACDGPAIVELPHTSVAVSPGQTLALDRAGHLRLTVASTVTRIAA